MPENFTRIGLLTLQPHRQLLANGTPVPLGRKALQLLSLLAEANGALVTKDEIMCALWPDMIVEENTLYVHMMAVRKALGEDARRLITIRSVGYQLDVDSGRCGNVAGMNGTEDGQAAVGVLRFANLTGDSAYDCLGESIAEELINRLSQYPTLKVSARTSSFASDANHEDARSIAENLHVDTILEGSIRKGGDTMRITAGLVDAQSGCYRWSDKFDHTFDNMLTLEDEVADRIAEIVANELGKA